MVGLTTNREPIRGAVALQMREHMEKRATLRKNGELQSTRPIRKSKIVIAEPTNA